MFYLHFSQRNNHIVGLPIKLNGLNKKEKQENKRRRKPLTLSTASLFTSVFTSFPPNTQKQRGWDNDFSDTKKLIRLRLLKAVTVKNGHESILLSLFFMLALSESQTRSISLSYGLSGIYGFFTLS